MARITGRWVPGTVPDNRDAEPKDITDEHYHSEYDTISCPHCGCTLSAFVCMRDHYCYACGGKFGDVNYTEPEDDEVDCPWR